MKAVKSKHLCILSGTVRPTKHVGVVFTWFFFWKGWGGGRGVVVEDTLYNASERPV